MKEIFTIISQKGGVGKSTTTAAIAAGARRQGYTVLTIDLDPQSNLSLSMGADTSGKTILDVLTGNTPALGAIQQTPQGEIIPASPALSSADMTLTQTGKEYRLREAIEPLCRRYDYIVLDTPPALGVLTVNALTAATAAIIPAQADLFSVQGITQLYGTIDTVKRYCNPALSVKGILLTRYSPRSVLSREMRDVMEGIATQHGGRVFDTFIRENIALREAQARQQSIFDYAPNSNGAADYRAFIKEIIPTKGGSGNNGSSKKEL